MSELPRFLECSSTSILRLRLPGAARRRPPASGFTLVELMVALALAAIISVSIMFISSQARLSYDETVKKVDVYNRFRYALFSIESDLKSWIINGDLEEYTDGRGKGARLNGHWDPGEEIQDRKDELGPGVVDGGIQGDYDEFAHIIQRHYVSREVLQPEEKVHDAYQLYFRTLTYVDGAMRLANVEYMLLDPTRVEKGIPPPPENVEPERVADLALFKIIRYNVIDEKSIVDVNVTRVERKLIEVCTNVTDFKLEYLVDKPPPGAYAASKVEPGFRTPEEDYKSPLETVTRPRHVQKLGARAGYRKLFGYGSNKLSEKYPLGVVYPGSRGDDNLSGRPPDHFPPRFGFQGSRDVFFGELTPGDKIYLYTETSGVGAQGRSGGGSGVAENRTVRTRFPAGDYTVRTNINGLLEFEEDLDTTDWNNQNKTGVYYKAGFLPAAVRITLRIVDDKGQNPKTLQREVWLRRRSR